jgi:ubiquinol-cytochrome c reductase cytochrome b subunit
MNAFTRWIEDRTGLVAGWGRIGRAQVPASTRWLRIWPPAILFSLVVEVVTGFVLWMYYSPGSQSAWESIYWVQYEVWGGWLVRGLHYYAGQVLLGLVALYVVHMILVGAYRAPRELVFWMAVGLGVITLGLLLTGDLLSWSQCGVKSTQVRTSYLTLIPWIGDALRKVAVGGSEFGHLTLTRFLALHVGLCGALACLLMYGHCRASARADRSQAAAGAPMVSYWAGSAVLGGVASLVALAVVLGLVGFRAASGQHAGQRPGDYLGVELGPPADATVPYEAARPDWYFVCLYQFANIFPAGTVGPLNLEIVPIFVLPGAIVVLLLAMPWIARLRGGHVFNIAVTLALLGAAVGLTLVSKGKDADDDRYQAAVAAGAEDAERVKQLIQAPEGIPVAGAATLLRNDPKTQGPRLFAQHCASCHDHVGPDGQGIKAQKASAPNLYDFGTVRWIAGLLDPKQVAGPGYFGGTAFHNGTMVRFVQGGLKEQRQSVGEKEFQQLLAGLAAEATGAPPEAVRKNLTQLLEDFTCTDCHHFHGKGKPGKAPDLTGYASAAWLRGIIGDPAHASFYGAKNDRMPAYAKTPDKPEDNVLSPRQLEMLADWLRGQWYQPK